MRWALVAHPDQWIRGRLVQTPRHIPESSLATARSQGWVALAEDSAVYGDRALKQHAAISTQKRKGRA